MWFPEKVCNEGVSGMDTVQYDRFSRAPAICTTTIIIIKDMEYKPELNWYWLNSAVTTVSIDVQQDEKIKAELLVYEKSKSSFNQPPQDESCSSKDDEGTNLITITDADVFLMC